jgi:hypothetical protein
MGRTPVRNVGEEVVDSARIGLHKQKCILKGAQGLQDVLRPVSDGRCGITMEIS